MDAKLFIFAAVAISEVFSACKPTNTSFRNFHKTPRRSETFFIEVSSAKCPGLNEFYYDWKVMEARGKGIVKTSAEQNIYIDGYNDFNSAVCFTTDYIVVVKVSHYPDMSFADQISDLFYFQADVMQIKITGGYQKSHRVDKDLVVDAKTLSVDTSYPPEEDAFKGNVISWNIEPPIEDFTPPNALTITIAKTYLRTNAVYFFTVTVIRKKIPRYPDRQKADQIVNIVSTDAPDLEAKCMRNCKMALSWESTVFSLVCYQNCENLQYSWSIAPPPPISQVDHDEKERSLKINGGTYKDGDQIYVTFQSGTISLIQSLKFVSGIVTGSCTITPETGISGVTLFEVNCKGFYSPYGLSRCIIFHHRGLNRDMILLAEYIYREMSWLYVPPGNPSRINIVVEDRAFLRADVTLEISVKKYQPKVGLPLLAGVKTLVLNTESHSVTYYSINGLNNKVVQLICCLLPTIEDLDSATKKDLHKHMMEALDRLQPVRLISIIQRLLVLTIIEKYRLKTDSVTSNLIAKVMSNDAWNIHYIFVHNDNVQIPHYYIRLSFEHSMRLSLSILNVSSELLDILNHDIAPHNYDSYDEFESKKLQIRHDYKRITTYITVAIEVNFLTMLFSEYDRTEIIYSSEKLYAVTNRKRLFNPKSGDILLSLDNDTETSVVLPFELISDLLAENPQVDYQLGVFKMNPFWWHEKVSSMTTHVTLFDLFFKCKKLKELSKPFFIQLDLLETPSQLISGTLTGRTVEAFRIPLEPNVTLVVEFYNDGEYPNDYSVTWSYCFCTDEDFLSTRGKIIKKGGANSSKILRVENENDARSIYICLKKLTPELSYSASMSTFSCLYWDLKFNEWRKGCKVIEPVIGISSTLRCQCQHLSLFIGEVTAPRSHVVDDLEINFTINFVQNKLMITFIVGLLLVWLLFLILAHLKDKSLRKKNVIHKLDDNVPGDSNPYLVVVFTGVFYDAQTTADVAFQIIGNKSQSRTHLIKCHGVTLLKRNSQDWFIIYSPNYLGEIKKIKIWHNCKGRYPHWYCDRIIVQDMKIGEQYCVTVKKWFSVIWGSGKIYRELRVKRSQTKMSKILFRTQLERDMKDKHIWLSIVTRDFQSNFNSKERVSTGFCFLFLSMLANALLYGIPHNAPSDSIDQQSSFDVGSENIIIFIESWLFAIPMSFLIYFIFKNSAPL